MGKGVPTVSNCVLADAVIEKLGGEETMLRELEEFRSLAIQVEQEQEALIDQHPHKWVAVAKEGLIAVGDTLEEVCEAAREKGFGNSQYLARYLNPNPPIYIL